MKVLIADILDEGLTVDIEEKLRLENHSVISPVTAHLDIQKMGDEVLVNGRLSVEVGFQCSRCLKEFRRTLDVPVQTVYRPITEMDAEAHELKVDEMDLGFYTGNELDLDEIMKEQILLGMQMKPLCDENCRGICPKCGTDLNTDTCSCESRSIDPRLEVLKSLFEKRKE